MRRRSSSSRMPQLASATSEVESARPDVPKPSTRTNDPVEREVDHDREQAHQHRRARVVERVERGRQHLDAGVAGEPDRVAGERLRRGGGVGGREAAVLVDAGRSPARRTTPSPAAAGTQSRATSSSACRSAERMASASPRATCRDTTGRVTVPIATPKSPIGSCMKRKATFSHDTGPLPRYEAKLLLTNTFTCTAAAPIVAGAMSRSTWRSAGSRSARTAGSGSRRAAATAAARASWRRPPSSVPNAMPVMARAVSAGSGAGGAPRMASSTPPR